MPGSSAVRGSADSAEELASDSIGPATEGAASLLAPGDWQPANACSKIISRTTSYPLVNRLPPDEPVDGGRSESPAMVEDLGPLRAERRTRRKGRTPAWAHGSLEPKERAGPGRRGPTCLRSAPRHVRIRGLDWETVAGTTPRPVRSVLRRPDWRLGEVNGLPSASGPYASPTANRLQPQPRPGQTPVRRRR